MLILIQNFVFQGVTTPAPNCDELQSCVPKESKVCGSNGITYPNLCSYRQAVCSGDSKVKFKYLGECLCKYLTLISFSPLQPL